MGSRYGAQTAFASGVIVSLLIRNDSIRAFHTDTHLLGHSALEVICFVVVWALQLLIIQNGMETVRRFQNWAGPAVWVAMLVLAVWLSVKAGGLSFTHTIPQDVHLIARQQVNVPALYQEHGDYRYTGGWNPNALVAAGVGAIFSSVLPHVGSLLPSWWGTYGWFFGVAIGGSLHLLLSRLRPRGVPALRPAVGLADG